MQTHMRVHNLKILKPGLVRTLFMCCNSTTNCLVPIGLGSLIQPTAKVVIQLGLNAGEEPSASFSGLRALIGLTLWHGV